jgi:hypothetical protein
MVIRYCDNSYVEGAIHSLESGIVRATVAFVDDALKYTLIQGRWTSERGAVVTFEFPVERGLNLCRIQPSQIMPVNIGEGAAGCAAGGDCALGRMPGSCMVN